MTYNEERFNDLECIPGWAREIYVTKPVPYDNVIWGYSINTKISDETKQCIRSQLVAEWLGL